MLRYWKFYLIFCCADSTIKDLGCLSHRIFNDELPNTLDVGGGKFNGSKKKLVPKYHPKRYIFVLYGIFVLISTIVNHFSPKLSNRSWTSEWKSGFLPSKLKNIFMQNGL